MGYPSPYPMGGTPPSDGVTPPTPPSYFFQATPLPPTSAMGGGGGYPSLAHEQELQFAWSSDGEALRPQSWILWGRGDTHPSCAMGGSYLPPAMAYPPYPPSNFFKGTPPPPTPLTMRDTFYHLRRGMPDQYGNWSICKAEWIFSAKKSFFLSAS